MPSIKHVKIPTSKSRNSQVKKLLPCLHWNQWCRLDWVAVSRCIRFRKLRIRIRLTLMCIRILIWFSFWYWSGSDFSLFWCGSGSSSEWRKYATTGLQPPWLHCATFQLLAFNLCGSESVLCLWCESRSGFSFWCGSGSGFSCQFVYGSATLLQTAGTDMVQ
jgi:hypothetical protein